MELFLYFLILLLAVLYAIEKFPKSDGTKQNDDPQGGGGLPDLSVALRNEKAREEFARRIPQAKVQPKTTDAPSPVVEKQISPPVMDCEEIELEIRNIHTPNSIEQGQSKVIIKMDLYNPTQKVLDIVSVQIAFSIEEEDVSAQYTVRGKGGNISRLFPQKTAIWSLVVEVSPGASLGEVHATPEFIFSLPDGAQYHLPIDKSFHWRVEPGGRQFSVITENKGKEIAGKSFYVELQTCRNQAPDYEYSGSHRVYFTLKGHSAIAHSAEGPESLELEFEQGRAITPSSFRFYNTVEQCAIIADEKKPGGAEGISDPVSLSPGPLESFQMDIATPQTNGNPFHGENTITAFDAYNNVKTDYRENTEIMCNIEGKIDGLSEGNIVEGNSFNNGIAELTGLTFTLKEQPVEGHIFDESKVIQFIASAKGKFGYSGDITMLPALPMSASETQAVIQRLLGYRKKKIWLINCEPDLAEVLTKSFHTKYDILSIEMLPEEVGEKFAGEQPDLLFLDSQDGYSILQKICRLPALENLQMIFMGSPCISENKISEILRCGSFFLTKPPSLPAVRAIVTDLLEKAGSVRGRLPVQGCRLPGSEGASYQVVAKIGEGGMGYIYEAKRMRDLQRVIIKYMPPRDIQNINSIVRFVQEAHAVMSFEHENLVAGYDLFMDRNRCYYVMEYIEGDSLEKYLHSMGKLEPAQATRIILQVAKALHALDQEHKLVHRDIKPANIILTPEGIVKLVDFGIAKVTNHKLTTMGIILGTPYYLSPEQIQGSNISIQSDIYSLGATFYHIITGKVPFQGNDVYTIIHQRLRQNNLRDPREFNPAVPKSISEVVIKMMQLKPRRRYATPKELIKDLEKILHCIDSGALALEEDEPISVWDETSEDGNVF